MIGFPLVSTGAAALRQTASGPQFGAFLPRKDRPTEQPSFYPAKPNRALITTSQGLVRYLMQKPIGFDCEISPADLRKLDALKRSGSSLMVTPNHASIMDFFTIHELERQAKLQFIAMGAVELFERRAFGLVWNLSGSYLQRMGIFSVNRAARDKEKSLDAAEDVLRKGEHPFLIFPEGRVSWTNRDVDGLKTGAARTAIEVAKEGKPVKIVPTAIYYDYKVDQSPVIEAGFSNLEKIMQKRIGYVPPVPAEGSANPLLERMNGLFGALVTDREQRYEVKKPFGITDPHTRLQHVMRQTLNRLEVKYVGQTRNASSELRARWLIGSLLNEKIGRQKNIAESDVKKDVKILQDIINLIMYSTDSLVNGDQNSLMESLVRIEREITGKERGMFKLGKDCKARIKVCDPLDVNALIKQAAPGTTDAQLAEKLTGLIQQRLEEALAKMASNPTYQPKKG